MTAKMALDEILQAVKADLEKDPDMPSYIMLKNKKGATEVHPIPDNGPPAFVYALRDIFAVFIRMRAREFEAKTCVSVCNAWMIQRSGKVPEDVGELPSQAEDRQSVLVVTVETSSGELDAVLLPYTTDEGRVLFGPPKQLSPEEGRQYSGRFVNILKEAA